MHEMESCQHADWVIETDAETLRVLPLIFTLWKRCLTCGSWFGDLIATMPRTHTYRASISTNAVTL